MNFQPHYRYKTSKKNFNITNKSKRFKTKWEASLSTAGSYDERYFAKHNWTQRFMEDWQKSNSLYTSNNSNITIPEKEKQEKEMKNKLLNKARSLRATKWGHESNFKNYMRSKSIKMEKEFKNNSYKSIESPVVLEDQKKAYEMQKNVYHRSYDGKIYKSRIWPDSSSSVNDPPLESRKSIGYMNYLMNRFVKKSENSDKKMSKDEHLYAFLYKSPKKSDSLSSLEPSVLTEKLKNKSLDEGKQVAVEHYTLRREFENKVYRSSYNDESNLPSLAPRFLHSNLLNPGHKKLPPKKIISFKERNFSILENNIDSFKQLKTKFASSKSQVREEEEEEDVKEVIYEEEPAIKSNSNLNDQKETKTKQDKSRHQRDKENNRKEDWNEDEVLIPVLSSTAHHLPEIQGPSNCLFG